MRMARPVNTANMPVTRVSLSPRILAMCARIAVSVIWEAIVVATPPVPDRVPPLTLASGPFAIALLGPCQSSFAPDIARCAPVRFAGGALILAGVWLASGEMRDAPTPPRPHHRGLDGGTALA